MGSESARMTFNLMLMISAFKIFLWPFAFIPAYGMRAAGDVKYTMLVSTITMWALRVGLCYYLCRYAGFGVSGVWIAIFADWFVRGVFYTLRFQKGKWMRKKVIY
jgi:Na+-driven multidrug efflux pump